MSYRDRMTISQLSAVVQKIESTHAIVLSLCISAQLVSSFSTLQVMKSLLAVCFG